MRVRNERLAAAAAVAMTYAAGAAAAEGPGVAEAVRAADRALAKVGCVDMLGLMRQLGTVSAP